MHSAAGPHLERLPVGGLRPVGQHGAAAALVGGDVRLPQRRLELHLRPVLHSITPPKSKP